MAIVIKILKMFFQNIMNTLSAVPNNNSINFKNASVPIYQNINANPEKNGEKIDNLEKEEKRGEEKKINFSF